MDNEDEERLNACLFHASAMIQAYNNSDIRKAELGLVRAAMRWFDSQYDRDNLNALLASCKKLKRLLCIPVPENAEKADG